MLRETIWLVVGWLRRAITQPFAELNRWQRAFAEDSIQFTVNKEFAELFTLLEHGDEIALIPKAK